MSASDRINDVLMPRLPKKWLSHALGHWVWKKPPHWINKKLVGTFAKTYDINVGEAEKPLSHYSSLGEFFSRKLKPGLRPVDGELISPCDGRMIRSGYITDGKLIQAKGKLFSLSEFVPKNPWASEMEKGVFATYYLSPKDYHRVHAPVSGSIQWVQVIPGELWPVNGWSVRNVERLYAVNERVAIGLETANGPCVVVMVGATNVGSVSLSFDGDIRTNEKGGVTQPLFRQYQDSKKLEVGAELGAFHLGSTVVVLYGSTFNLNPLASKKVQMGQSIL